MSGWLSLGITIILMVVAFVVLNRRIASRTDQQTALDDIRREVGSILTEINATTEQNIELLEDKIRTLQELLSQADKRLGALRRDITTREQASTPTSTYSDLARHRRPVVRPRTEESFIISQNGTLRQEISEPKAPPAEEREDKTPRERIRDLYLSGVPLERIASAVGKTVGEVELIVSLDQGERGGSTE